MCDDAALSRRTVCLRETRVGAIRWFYCGLVTLAGRVDFSGGFSFSIHEVPDVFYSELRRTCPRVWLKCVFVAFLAATNIVGVRAAGRVNDALTLLKLAPLVFFVIAGISWIALTPQMQRQLIFLRLHRLGLQASAQQ